MWRGGSRPGISVAAPFVWRCLSGSTIAPFPHPSHRTGHADSLAGGADKLANRAAVLAQGGRTRLVAHLAELAAAASPQDRAIQATQASVYERCAEAETSLIGKALFAVYQREAKAKSTF